MKVREGPCYRCPILFKLASPYPAPEIPPVNYCPACVSESLRQADQNLIVEIRDIIDVERLAELIYGEQMTFDAIRFTVVARYG